MNNKHNDFGFNFYGFTLQEPIVVFSCFLLICRMSENRIQSITIYPIKSLGPVHLQEAWVEPSGLRGDRRYMLVNANHQFITQRTRPELTRFGLEAIEGGFLVNDRQTQTQKFLSHEAALGPLIPVTIWEDEVLAAEVLDEWSAWFSDRLGEPCFLVLQDAAHIRSIQEKYQTIGSAQSSFADSLPILLCSEASFTAVADVIGKDINPLRFRANVIISGSLAFEEDTWAEIQIGDSQRWKGAKPCARCQLVNVNPVDGTKDDHTLRALAGFRTFGNKVYFGQQFVPISLGKINVGDLIHPIQLKDAVY